MAHLLACTLYKRFSKLIWTACHQCKVCLMHCPIRCLARQTCTGIHLLDIPSRVACQYCRSAESALNAVPHISFGPGGAAVMSAVGRADRSAHALLLQLHWSVQVGENLAFLPCGRLPARSTSLGFLAGRGKLCTMFNQGLRLVLIIQSMSK